MVVDLGQVEWIAGIAATAPGEWAAAERHHEEIRPPDPSGVDQVGPMLIAPDETSYVYSYRRALDELYLATGLK
jgi:hypothetical protein